MYTLSEKAIIYLESLTYLEYKHKRAILDLYDEPCELFENPTLANDYIRCNLLKQVNDLESIDESKVDAICDKYAKQARQLQSVSTNTPKAQTVGICSLLA